MAQNVRFIAVKMQSSYDALEVKDSLALYWIQDTQRLYKGDKLYGAGSLASEKASGLLSSEDYIALKSLITSGGIGNLTAVDGTILLNDIGNGVKTIGVAIAPNENNALVAVDGGLFVPTVVVPEYSIEKQETAEDGFAASYKLKKVVDGKSSYVGDTINIAKDLVLKSATLEVVTENNIPYDGAVVGDTYICMTFNDENVSSLYIPINGLVSQFKAGAGIEIQDNVISVKIDDNSHGLVSVNGNMTMLLATKDNDGSMSKEDKAKLDSIPSVYVARKYDVAYKPDNTLVDYRDKEVRIMIPADTQFSLQNSGEGADANSYYIGFKAYAPSGSASFKEDLAEIITDDTMYYFNDNQFAGIDVYGRKYSIVWLPVAKNIDGVWSYHGVNSSIGKYVGWYYTVEWYDANGKIIECDQIRINLSNEDCHNSIMPFYMANYATSKEVETIKESVSNAEESYTWNEL